MKAIEEIESYRARFGDNALGGIWQGYGFDKATVSDLMSPECCCLMASLTSGKHLLNYIKTLHNSFPALRDRIRELEEVVKQKDVTVRKFRLEIRELENEVSALSITNKTLASNAIQPNDQSKKIERLRIEKGELEEKVEDGRVRIEELELTKQRATDDAVCYLEQSRNWRREANKLEHENRELKKQVGQLEEKNRDLFNAALEFSYRVKRSNKEFIHASQEMRCGAVREGGE